MQWKGSEFTVLFVCVHNAGRSQMAEAFLRRVARDRGLPFAAASAGTTGAGSLNPVVVDAMAEVGVPLDGHIPKLLTPEMVAASSAIISMGCGVDAEACPTRFLVTEDWGLPDPAGQPLPVVREVRDLVRQHVEAWVEAWVSVHAQTKG